MTDAPQKAGTDGPGDALNAVEKRHLAIWVCAGRLCRSRGSDAVASATTTAAINSLAGDVDVQVGRGGCYGLCDLGPNVVVRRFTSAVDAAHDAEADRLSLTNADNESVYCGVAPAEVATIVNAHVVDDEPYAPFTRGRRAHELEASSPIERRMRALREARARAQAVPPPSAEAREPNETGGSDDG